MGHATSGVILSTVRLAADLDYHVIVVEDGCADRDPDVHTPDGEGVPAASRWSVPQRWWRRWERDGRHLRAAGCDNLWNGYVA